MNPEELAHFLNTVAASTMASKAIFTLYMAGLPITPENAATAYGRWIDPNMPNFEQFVLAIDAQVKEMMDTAVELSPATAGSA
ncbi:hypothetical protein [Brucella anthropi]|uniref:hypothetical protein n=1 Tax=Brucella anthropi TaxID=529 RepID=UPI003D959DBC